MVLAKRASGGLRLIAHGAPWALILFIFAELFGFISSAVALAEEDHGSIVLSPPFFAKRFGSLVFFADRGKDDA